MTDKRFEELQGLTESFERTNARFETALDGLQQLVDERARLSALNERLRTALDRLVGVLDEYDDDGLLPMKADRLDAARDDANEAIAAARQEQEDSR